MELLWDGATKVCSNGPGHMTKKAAMPNIYGKKIKFASSEPNGRDNLNVVNGIGHSSSTKFVQMMTLSWPLTFLRTGQIWFPMLVYGKMPK